ncbi:MAG: hypothetical protein IJJ26_06645 [Victivallales bacterium]|nr:hypothetical protein [Victivallales bacterium]
MNKMNNWIRLILVALVSFQLAACADGLADSADDLFDFFNSFTTEASEKLSDAENSLAKIGEAVNELKDKTDDYVNGLLDTLNDKSKLQKELEGAAGELAKYLEKEGFDKGTISAANEVLKQITSGKSIDGDKLLELATDIAVDKAKASLGKHIGEENAAKIVDYAHQIIDGDMSLDEVLTDGIENFVKDKLPPDTAKAVNELITSIVEGDDRLLDLATDLALDKAKESLGKYIGEENAAKVVDYAHKIIDGDMSLEEALTDGLEGFIKDKLPPNTANAVNEFITSIVEGEGLDDIMGSMGDMLQSAATDGIASLLDKTGLTKEQKESVMDVVDSAMNGDWEGAWDKVKDGAGDYLAGIVKDKFGEKAGEEAKQAISSLLNGDTGEFLNSVLDLGSTIATTQLEKLISGQLDKLAAKYPILGDVFKKLGIDGGSVMSAITNCWNALKDGKLTEMFTNLMGKITDYLNNLTDKLKDFAQNFLSKMMNVVTDFFDGLLNDLVDKIAGAVKAALGGFVNSLNKLMEKIAGASSYFLGNEGGEAPALIDIKNNIKDAVQTKVFKAQGAQSRGNCKTTAHPPKRRAPGRWCRKEFCNSR